MNNQKVVNIVVLATGKYLPLGLRLVHRFNHFYIGNSKILFHIFSDNDPRQFIDDANVIYYAMDLVDWRSTVVKKFEACLEALKCPGDYFICMDADSNIHRHFDDEKILGDLIIAEHITNSDFNNHVHYEKNELSSAYIDPKDYPAKYYQSSYMGGTKAEFHKLIEHAEKLRKIDSIAGIMACAEDESYVQKYLVQFPPKTVFKQDLDFPIFMNDKGGKNNHWGKTIELFSDSEYEQIMDLILSVKASKNLWDIVDGKTVIAH